MKRQRYRALAVQFKARLAFANASAIGFQPITIAIFWCWAVMMSLRSPGQKPFRSPDWPIPRQHTASSADLPTASEYALIDMTKTSRNPSALSSGVAIDNSAIRVIRLANGSPAGAALRGLVSLKPRQSGPNSLPWFNCKKIGSDCNEPNEKRGRRSFDYAGVGFGHRRPDYSPGHELHRR